MYAWLLYYKTVSSKIIVLELKVNLRSCTLSSFKDFHRKFIPLSIRVQFMAARLKLSSPIESITGLATAKCELLKKNFKIFTVYDLLHHYPFRYIDKSKVYQVAEVDKKISNIYSSTELFHSFK